MSYIDRFFVYFGSKMVQLLIRPGHWADVARQFAIMGLFVVAYWVAVRMSLHPNKMIFIFLSALAVLLVSLPAWVSVLRRYRLLSGTPASRVSAAAQGYGAIKGTGKAFGGDPLIVPGLNIPCLWYRKAITKTDISEGYQVGSFAQSTSYEQSSASFLIEDRGKECLIDAEQAQIETVHKKVFDAVSHKVTYWMLLPGDTICAFGQLRTKNFGDEQFDTRGEINDLLTQWKQDKAQLFKRFDLDDDGQISEAEWALARQAAKREVAKSQQERQSAGSLTMLSAPTDGRMFYVTNRKLPEEIRRYLLRTMYHLAIFVVAIMGCVWAWKRF